MRILFTAVLLLSICSFRSSAQDLRQFTPEEKALHAKNNAGIIGKWNTTLTAIQIVEEALKPKQAELEKVYTGLFDRSVWDFSAGGKMTLTTYGKETPAADPGTFTVNAQFLTLYVDGKTYRCLMKLEDDGKLIIHFPITGKSIFALQLEKQAH